MGRNLSEEKLRRIYNEVKDYPGEKPGTIARVLGLNRSEVTRMLPALEDRGFYVYEDEGGGLWPFDRDA